MGPELRRNALRGVLAAAAIGGAGALAAAAMVPGAIRARAQALAEARLGLPLSVGRVRLAGAGAELTELHLGGDGDGLEVRIDRMRVGVDPWRLPFDGRAALRSLDVGRVDVTLAGRSVALARLLTSDAAPRFRDAGARTPGDLPVVSIDRIEVNVSDAIGPLVDATLPDVRLADGVLGVRQAAVVVGEPRAGGLELEGLAVHARRDQGWRLSEASVERVRLDLPPAEGAAHDTTDGAPSAPAPAPAGDDSGVEPKKRNDSGVLSKGLLARLRALDPRPPAGQKGADAPTEASPQPRSVLSRLSADARLSLVKGSVTGVLAGKRAQVARGLSMELSRGADGKWRFEGKARGTEGGRVEWALSISDDPIAANGQLDVSGMPLPLLAHLLPSVPWHHPEQSHLDARLVLETRSVDRIAFSGEVDLVNAAILSDRVAPVVLDAIDLSFSGQGYLLPLDRKLEIERGGVEVQDARVDLHGWLSSSGGRYAADLQLTLAETPCDRAIRAIPAGLLGDLVHASWDGSLGGRVRLRIDTEHLEETELDIDVTDRCGFVTVPAIVDLRRFRQPFVHTVLEPDGTFVELETGPGTMTWTYLEDVSPFLVHAVLSHEDSRFFSHGGFSPPHIRNALVKNLQQGRYAVGASTITMQLVKNIFLRREKTLARKTQEVLLTWWIERVMEKRDILELYLNVIEYGPGVYGIRNAAMHYFKRLPSDLSPAEAVYLSTILPNPKKYYGAYERGSISERWAERMRKIFARLRARKRYSAEATRYGLGELANFRFVREGEFAGPRQVEGTAAALPYMGGLGPWTDGDGEASPAEMEVDDAGDEVGWGEPPAAAGMADVEVAP